MCCSIFIALKRSSTSNQLSLAIYSFGAMLPLGFLPSSFPFPLPILDPTIFGRRLPVDYPSTSLAFSSPFLVMALHIYVCLQEAAYHIIVNFWAPPHHLGRGPKSLNFPDGNFQRAKTFRTKCVNRFRDKKSA